MSKTTAPAERYATDLTKTDVAELLGWIRGHLDPLDPTARALEVFLGESVSVLNLSIEMRDATSPRDGVTELAHLQAIRREWNQLVRAALPWRDRPGYDPARWDRVQTNTYSGRENRMAEQRAEAQFLAERAWAATWEQVNTRLTALGTDPAEPEDTLGTPSQEFARVGQLTLAQALTLLQLPGADQVRTLHQRTTAWAEVNQHLAAAGLPAAEILGRHESGLPDDQRAQYAVLTIDQATALSPTATGADR